MSELIVATSLWKPNRHSFSYSAHYTENDVEKLYRGFKRNLTVPFRFVVFTDQEYEFGEPIHQERMTGSSFSYKDTLQPYKLNQPMIRVGLDTVIVGNCDHFAEYCFTADRLALPLDPYKPSRVCSGVAFTPAGYGWLWDQFEDSGSKIADMDWLRRHETAIIDHEFPGQVVSYKGHVKANGMGDARIVFFHGKEKPHELNHGWIKEHWR